MGYGQISMRPLPSNMNENNVTRVTPDPFLFLVTSLTPTHCLQEESAPQFWLATSGNGKNSWDFLAERVASMGACTLAPLMVVIRDIHRRMKAEKVTEILNAARSNYIGVKADRIVAEMCSSGSFRKDFENWNHYYRLYMPILICLTLF